MRGDDARCQPGARQIAFDPRGLRGGTQQRQLPPPLFIACLPNGGAGLQHGPHRIAVPVRIQQRGIVGAGVQAVARAPPPDLGPDRGDEQVGPRQGPIGQHPTRLRHRPPGGDGEQQPVVALRVPIDEPCGGHRAAGQRAVDVAGQDAAHRATRQGGGALQVPADRHRPSRPVPPVKGLQRAGLRADRALRVVHHAQAGRGDLRRVAGIDQRAVAQLCHDVHGAAVPGRNHGNAGLRRLDQGKAEGFVQRRVHEDAPLRCPRVQRPQLTRIVARRQGDLAPQAMAVDPVEQSAQHLRLFGRPAIDAVAQPGQDHQVGAVLQLGRCGIGIDQPCQVLLGHGTGHRQNDGTIRPAQERRQQRICRRGAHIGQQRHAGGHAMAAPLGRLAIGAQLALGLVARGHDDRGGTLDGRPLGRDPVAQIGTAGGGRVLLQGQRMGGIDPGNAEPLLRRPGQARGVGEMRVNHVGLLRHPAKHRAERLGQGGQLGLQGLLGQICAIGGRQAQDAAAGRDLLHRLRVDGIHAVERTGDDVDRCHLRQRRLCHGSTQDIGDVAAGILGHAIAHGGSLQAAAQGKVKNVHDCAFRQTDCRPCNAAIAQRTTPHRRGFTGKRPSKER